MDKLIKSAALTRATVDVEADIGLINAYTQKELTPEEVFAFPLILCDNNVDRDMEAFTAQALAKLAPLFVGKPVIFDHSWSAKGQTARIYKTEVVDMADKTTTGENLRQLQAVAYIPKADYTQEAISKIESGILKEGSVGFAASRAKCSICGQTMGWSKCPEDHQRGQTYAEGLCYGVIDNPTDAYEFSFVAVPAQRAAGVRKGFDGGIEDAIAFLAEADLSGHLDAMEPIIKAYHQAQLTDADRKARADILAENQKFVGGKQT